MQTKLARGVLAALRARSVVDVTFTQPMVFFTHSQFVTPMIHKIMVCSHELLCEFSLYPTSGQRFGIKPAPKSDFIAGAILQVVPSLQASTVHGGRRMKTI